MGGFTVGLDVGSSSVKASVLQIATAKVIGSYASPDRNDEELPIIALQKSWAQQNPEIWWQHSKVAIRGALKDAKIAGVNVEAIGVGYQMHGMTPLDVDGKPLMDAIIWCDGRTTAQKESVEKNIPLANRFLEECLNLPGHFTASKLTWFKENVPDLYAILDKFVLPGHYILRKATGEATITASGLSEGIFWNFKDMCLSDLVLNHFGLNKYHIPQIKPTFGEHGRLTKTGANDLGLKEGTPFTYFAGDQPNNAFSLRVLEPGEIAATAGTSAVIYGITDRLLFDNQSRVNQFLHVNSSINDPSRLRIGVLACMNSAGISYRYFRDRLGGGSYQRMNQLASSVQDDEDLFYIPFGNGPERTQLDKNTGAHLIGLDLNRHTEGHVFRAVQVGVAFAMKYSAEIMKGMGVPVTAIKAGHANMFLSPLFGQIFADALQVPVELYDTDGSAGAARGAAVGRNKHDLRTAFSGLTKVKEIIPSKNLDRQYDNWCAKVNNLL